MLTVKALRDNLLPVSPQTAIENWIRVFDTHGESPEFENPRVMLTMRSGAQFMGYLVGVAGSQNNHDRHVIVSLVMKHETDQARDVVFLNLSDVEAITFYDIDPVMPFFARR